MKKTILAFVSVLLAVASSQATTISVADSAGALSEPLLTDPLTGGDLLPNGGALIRIGYFRGFTTSGNNAVLIAALNAPLKEQVYPVIQNEFIPLGEGLDSDLGAVPTAATAPRVANRTINGVPNQPGRLIGGISGVNPNTDPEASVANPITGVPAGTRIFILAYNAPDAASATQLGVYSAENWLMPASAAAALQLNTTNIDSPSEVIRGVQASLHLRAFIPEPSTGMMALLAGLGLVSRRRR